MLYQIDPNVPPILDPAYLGSTVFPWINTICAIISFAWVAFYVYRTKSILPEAALAIVPVVLCGIGYGLFALKLIDQQLLTTIVRPTLGFLILSVAVSSIAELHRRKIWTLRHPRLSK